jgi:hypothetical protein
MGVQRPPLGSRHRYLPLLLVTDPKLLAEQQQRAELERLAKEDPDSWAATATRVRTDAQTRYTKLLATNPIPGRLSKAMSELAASEKLERQVIARYQTLEADLAKKARRQEPPQDDPTEQNEFTDALRTEHTQDNGRPATTGTDPTTNKPTTQEDQANGVLAAAPATDGSSARTRALV